MKKIMEIELKSDLCSSSGENYSVSIDSDICYDEYGLPFIPAKRIKGCLKESAEELLRFGLIEENTIQKIFGNNGGIAGNLVVRNAFVKDYDDLRNAIHLSMYKKYLHPQKILEQYTYVRAQTAIEKNGIAKDHSLRFTRIVRKGVKFNCIFEVQSKDEEEDFGKCVAAFRHMGVARSRGLGEIKATILSKEIEDKVENKETIFSKVRAAPSKTYILDYTLRLDSAVMFPKAEGGAEKTELFIPGSSIRGFFAAEMQKKQLKIDYKKWFYGNELIFQNAYISDGKKRFQPASSAILKEKDAGFSSSINSLYEFSRNKEENVKDERPQYKAIGGKYLTNSVDNTVDCLEVETEINYHYHVTKNKADSQFFQYTSLSAGQLFSGRIIGTGEALEQVFGVWPKDNNAFTLGRSKTAQYGSVSVEDICISEVNNPTELKAKKFVVQLLSPCVLLNDTGVYNASIQTLKSEIEKLLKGVAIEEKKIVLRYKTIGGFNVKWGLPKQQLLAFDAGTICVFEGKDSDIDLSVFSNCHIGEYVSEGYGEIAVYPFSEVKEKICVQTITTENEKHQLSDEVRKQESENSLFSGIFERALLEQVKMQALSAAMENNLNATTVGRLNMMLKESEKNMSCFCENFLAIKDKEKLMNCASALFRLKKEKFNQIVDSDNGEEKVREMKKNIEKFLKKIVEETEIYKDVFIQNSNITVNYEDVFTTYISSILEQMKFNLR